MQVKSGSNTRDARPAKSRRKRINQAIGSALISAVVAFSRLLPLRAKRRAGILAGRFLFAAVRKRREQALRSIDLAFGDSLSPEEKQRIARESLENLGIGAMEFSHIPRIGANIDRLITIEGMETLDRSQGGVFVSGHMANWEWMAPILATQNVPVAEVVQSYEREPYAVQLNTMRERGGIVTVPQDRASTEVRKLLAKKYCVGILIDRSPRDSGVPVTFFGRECWATSGPAFIALRSKVPLYFGEFFRKEDGMYHGRFSRIDPPAPSGSFRDDVRAYTQLMQNEMERHIRAHPGQWFWMTNRWRRREHLEARWKDRAAGSVEAGD